MTRFAFAFAVALAATGALATTGGAREAAGFTCPKSVTTSQSPTAWVKNYDGYRGSTWCDDGATASVQVSVPPKSLAFTGGVCTQSKKNGSLYLQIGTRVSPAKNRKAKDPKGLFLNNPTASTGLDKWLDIGTPTLQWADNVTIAWKGLKGTFSGKTGLWINDKYTIVKASGSFACKRIVKTAL